MVQDDEPSSKTDESTLNLNRRKLMKRTGQLSGTAVALSAVGPAAASSGEWSASTTSETYHDSYSGQDYRCELGTGLIHEGSGKAGSTWFHTFQVSGHGLVVNDDTGEFPANSDRYYERNDDCSPPDYTMNVGTQGFTLSGDSSLFYYIEQGGDEGFMHPPPCNADQKDAEMVAEAVVKEAVGALSGPAGAILSASEVIYKLTQDTIDEKDYTYSYVPGLLRGGYGGELVIECDEGEFGNVSVDANFGIANTGFDVFVDEGSYSVTTKD